MASLASLARAPVAQQSVAAAQRRQLAAAPGFCASGQQRQRRQLVVVAGQGFGSTQQNAGPRVSNKKKQPKIARYLERDVAKEAAADDGDTDGWIEMPNVDVETTFVSKPIKPLILATGRAVCVFKVGAETCSVVHTLCAVPECFFLPPVSATRFPLLRACTCACAGRRYCFCQRRQQHSL